MHSTNYLKATGLRLGLLPNFGKPRPEIDAWSTAGAPP
jgi:hypothetical protein